MHTAIAASVAMLLLLSGAALAQEVAKQEPPGAQSTGLAARRAPQAIEELVITARKREEPGQSVPISISAFTGDELDQAQMRNLLTVGELTPNLEIQQVYPNSRPVIRIRGVGTFDQFTPEVVGSVGVYKDGVYLSLATGLLFQTFDLDRMEVLRGPQGTLYGKSATAGAINFHSKMPGDEFGGYFQASYGNWNTFNVEGAVNVPINEKTAARVSFARRKSDGWMDNHGPGHDSLWDDDHWGVRGLLSYQPNENLSLLLNAHGGRLKTDWAYASRGLMDPDDVDSRSFNFIDPDTGGFRPEGPFNCPTSIFQGGCADLTGHVGGGEKSLRDVQTPEPVMEQIDLWGTSLTANYDMDTRWGPVTVTSITAYESARAKLWEDTEAGPFWLFNYRADAFSYQFTQELRAASSGDGPLQWLGGAWFFRSNIRPRVDSYSPPDGTIGGTFGLSTKSLSGDKFLTENYAFFGQLSYDVTERLRLTAGLRYSWERKQSRQYSFVYTEYGPTPDEGISSGHPCGPAPEQQDALACGPGRNESDSWDALSGQFVLDYQLADDIMLYASYRRGFRSGAFGVPLSNDARMVRIAAGKSLDTAVDEEILKSYEAGIKSMWLDRRLRFNFSTFLYDYDDLQVVTTVLIGRRIRTILENASDAKIWGGEIDMMARPLPGLEIRAAGAWLSTEYKDFVSVTQAADFSGKEMMSAPNYSGSGTISYERNLWDGVLRGQLAASYSDEVFYAATNSKRSRQGPVWLVNGNLSYLLPDERTEISVWVRNWGDKEYIANFFDISGFGFDQVLSSRPRHYGVTVRYSF